MDESGFNEFKKKYDSFQKEIENQIREKKVSYLINKNDYYFLINDSLIDRLNPNSQYDNQKTSKTEKDNITHSLLILPKKGKDIIII